MNPIRVDSLSDVDAVIDKEARVIVLTNRFDLFSENKEFPTAKVFLSELNSPYPAVQRPLKNPEQVSSLSLVPVCDQVKIKVREA